MKCNDSKEFKGSSFSLQNSRATQRLPQIAVRVSMSQLPCVESKFLTCIMLHHEIAADATELYIRFGLLLNDDVWAIAQGGHHNGRRGRGGRDS